MLLQRIDLYTRIRVVPNACIVYRHMIYVHKYVYSNRTVLQSQYINRISLQNINTVERVARLYIYIFIIS